MIMGCNGHKTLDKKYLWAEVLSQELLSNWEAAGELAIIESVRTWVSDRVSAGSNQEGEVPIHLICFTQAGRQWMSRCWSLFFEVIPNFCPGPERSATLPLPQEVVIPTIKLLLLQWTWMIDAMMIFLQVPHLWIWKVETLLECPFAALPWLILTHVSPFVAPWCLLSRSASLQFHSVCKCAFLKSNFQWEIRLSKFSNI